MKFKRKTDNIVKDVQDKDLIKRLSVNPNYEAVSNESEGSRNIAQAPVTEEPGIMSTIGDTVRGGVQGATLGASDEIYGALGATAEKAGGVITGKETPNWTDLYRQYQEAEQGRNKASQEASPFMYGAGELAGAVGTGLLTAGAAPASMGLRAAAEVGAGEVAKQLGKSAAVGAVGGAIQSAGTSEGNLDSIESRAKLTNDIASGAKFGGAAGAAMPIIGAGAGATKDYLVKKAEESPFWRGILQGWDRGKNQAPIGKSNIGRERAALEKDTLKNVHVNNFLDADKQISTMYGQVVDAATEKGVEIPLTAESIKGLVGLDSLAAGNQVLKETSDYTTLKNYVTKLSGRGYLNPREVVDLKKQVKTIAEGLDDQAAKQFAVKLEQDITDSLSKNVSGFKEVNGLMANYRGNVLDKLVEKPFQKVANPEKLAGNKFQNLLEKYSAADDHGSAAITKTNTLADGLDKLETQSPGILDELNLKTGNAFKEDLAKGSDIYDFQHKMLGNYGHSGGGSALKANLSHGASYGVGRLYGTAQLAGGFSRKAKSWLNIPLEELDGIAQKLTGSQNQMAQDVGNYLSQAVQNKDSFKKNSALFIINQNPALKEILGFGTEEGE